MAAEKCGIFIIFADFWQPVLRADLLDELHCTLAPVEVFLLVLQVSLQQVVGGRIVLQVGHALHQHLNARSLDSEVGLEFLQI